MYIRKKDWKAYELYWLWLILDIFKYVPEFPSIKMHSIWYCTLRDVGFMVVDLWTLRRVLPLSCILHKCSLHPYIDLYSFLQVQASANWLHCNCNARSKSTERQVAGAKQNGHYPCIKNRPFQYTQIPKVQGKLISVRQKGVPGCSWRGVYKVVKRKCFQEMLKGTMFQAHHQAHTDNVSQNSFCCLIEHILPSYINSHSAFGDCTICCYFPAKK